MKRSMQFEFAFAVKRWQDTQPKPADWLCGPPHFHDVPPKMKQHPHPPRNDFRIFFIIFSQQLEYLF